MRRSTVTLTLAAILVAPLFANAQERIAEIRVDDFARLQAAIRPLPGQSSWRDIPWLTNITEARQRSLAEDKPILIFTAADGSPLGRT